MESHKLILTDSSILAKNFSDELLMQIGSLIEEEKFNL
jgi:hypothetical protein